MYIKNAKEIYLGKNDEMFIVVDDGEIAYRFSKHTLNYEKIKREYSWNVWFESISAQKAEEIKSDWIKEQIVHKHRLNSAIKFATEKHSEQFRKGTSIPYIVHPLEVMNILYSMGADTDVLIAGVLHDTVEDTDTTFDEIKEMFGENVALLVASNSEDKSKTWIERKQHTIDELISADKQVKMLIMADKLSNLRSIARDYEQIGDKLFERFNAPKQKQAWYYDGILDALFDMQYVPECEKAYWEITGLFKDVFVKYYLDEENEFIYQVCEAGASYCLKKGNSEWNDVSDVISEMISDEIVKHQDDVPLFYRMNSSPDDIKPISRKDAEFLEDMWNCRI